LVTLPCKQLRLRQGGGAAAAAATVALAMGPCQQYCLVWSFLLEKELCLEQQGHHLGVSCFHLSSSRWGGAAAVAAAAAAAPEGLVSRWRVSRFPWRGWI